jgi:hypothetical protein
MAISINTVRFHIRNIFDRGLRGAYAYANPYSDGYTKAYSDTQGSHDPTASPNTAALRRELVSNS